MTIFLIGFMGCGKTTRGKQLASLLKFDFIDLDEFIERKYKTSIPILFHRVGENGFRVIERDSLLEVMNTPDAVISTGGGAPCFFDNISLINQNGISVYLRLSPEELANRLMLAKKKRPLLKNKTRQELIEYIQTTLYHREQFYRKAKITIDTELVSNQDLIKILNERFQ